VVKDVGHFWEGETDVDRSDYGPGCEDAKVGIYNSGLSRANSGYGRNEHTGCHGGVGCYDGNSVTGGDASLYQGVGKILSALSPGNRLK
jgi:hypothetical protein